MNKNKTETVAQLYDRFLSRTTLGLFVLAIALAVDCAGYLVSEDLHGTLRYIRRGLSLVIFLTIIPVLVKWLRVRMKQGLDCEQPESFLTNVYEKACMYGFIAAMVSIILLQIILGADSTSLPAVFYLKLVFAVATLAVSLSFYIQTRGDDGEDFDGEAIE